MDPAVNVGSLSTRTTFDSANETFQDISRDARHCTQMHAKTMSAASDRYHRHLASGGKEFSDCIRSVASRCTNKDPSSSECTDKRLALTSAALRSRQRWSTSAVDA